jgi:hypothetical protein
MDKLEFTFTAPLWVYQGKGAWHFVTLPKEEATRIRFFNGAAVGFMPIPVIVTIGSTTWKTSVFPDSKSGSYLLAVKAAVRKAEGIEKGSEVTVKLQIKV